MAQLHLTIITPLGLEFDGEAEMVRVRTTTGDAAILPRHIDYAAALGTGKAKVVAKGVAREAELSGGMMVVYKGNVEILTSSFVWDQTA